MAKKIQAVVQNVWEYDTEFLEIYQSISHVIRLDFPRAYTLYQFANQSKCYGGEFAEVGVFTGGSAALLARLSGGLPLHLFDTFSGIPSITKGVDRKVCGLYSDTSVDQISELFVKYPNVKIYEGEFDDNKNNIESNKFSLVHIDCDVHPCVMSSLDFFYPRMLKGGAIIIDDYGAKLWPGVKKAVDDFMKDKPEFKIKTHLIQCMIIKV